MSIAAAKKFHTGHVAARIGPPVGARLEEVDALEEKIGFPLPYEYRQYLIWMGRDHHGIFRGSAWFIDSIFSNKETLRGLLEEAGSPYVVKESHVVFFAHQGYMAAWFDAEQAEHDPECWFMDDGMAGPREAGVFSSLLLKDLQGLAAGFEGR